MFACSTVCLCDGLFSFFSLLQIVAPYPGNVTAYGGTSFTCPAGSFFVDTYSGMYGPDGSYLIDDAFSCLAAEGATVHISTLQFQCVPCPVGTYTLQAGGSKYARSCRSCQSQLILCRPFASLSSSCARVSQSSASVSSRQSVTSC